MKSQRQLCDKAERERDTANSRLQKLQDTIEDLELAKEVLDYDMDTLRREKNDLQARLDEASTAVGQWQGACEALNHRLQELEEKLQLWKRAYAIADDDRKELKTTNDVGLA